MSAPTFNDYLDRMNAPNPIMLEVLDERGRLVCVKRMINSRVQAGGVAAATAQFGGVGIAFKYVALSSLSSLAPANADTTLGGEIVTLGLSRALGAVTLPTTQSALNATCATNVTATYNATGSITIYGAGLFSAISGGTLGYEATCSATSVSNGFTVNVSWTLNE